jgi:hypothetical protein
VGGEGTIEGDKGVAVVRKMEFRTNCHPNAYGRVSADDETVWDVYFELETGVTLKVSCGKAGWERFRRDILKDDVGRAMGEANKEMSR